MKHAKPDLPRLTVALRKKFKRALKRRAPASYYQKRIIEFHVRHGKKVKVNKV